MDVDALERSVSTAVGSALLIAAAGLLVAPGAWRPGAMWLSGVFRRLSSSAQRRTLGLAGACSGAIGLVSLVRPWRVTTAAVVASFAITAWVRSRSTRRGSTAHRLRLDRRARRWVDAYRRRAARRTALALTRRTVDAEIDVSVQECADLAWWAARIGSGSVPLGEKRVAVHTVVVPGRHGELTAVVPESGALTLVLLTSTGPVDGVSVRVTI